MSEVSENLVLESRTITTYSYNEAGLVTEEVKNYYKPPTPNPEPETGPEPYALATIFVEHGGQAPEGYVILHKDHVFSKGSVYSLPPTTEEEETPQEYTCQDCEHELTDADNPESPCFKDYDNPEAPESKYGSDCPNFKKQEVDPK